MWVRPCIIVGCRFIAVRIMYCSLRTCVIWRDKKDVLRVKVWYVHYRAGHRAPQIFKNPYLMIFLQSFSPFSLQKIKKKDLQSSQMTSCDEIVVKKCEMLISYFIFFSVNFYASLLRNCQFAGKGLICT